MGTVCGINIRQHLVAEGNIDRSQRNFQMLHLSCAKDCRSHEGSRATPRQRHLIDIQTVLFRDRFIGCHGVPNTLGHAPAQIAIDRHAAAFWNGPTRILPA